MVLVAAICFGLGLGAGAFWFHRAPEPIPVSASEDASMQPAVAEPDYPKTQLTPDQRRNARTTQATPADPATIEAVKRAIPNLASVSLDEGMRMLRIASLKEFATAAQEMADQVKVAEQRLSQAQNGGSEADQQAAIKQLQQVQTGQTGKLQEIAARSKAQLEAFKQLKAAGP